MFAWRGAIQGAGGFAGEVDEARGVGGHQHVLGQCHGGGETGFEGCVVGSLFGDSVGRGDVGLNRGLLAPDDELGE